MKWTFFLPGAMLAICAPVSALTVWTDWTAATPGASGSASGTLGTIDVSYSGQVLGNTSVNGEAAGTWAPSSSFVGGAVDTSPAVVGDMITLNGGGAGTHTLTFSSPVTDPVFAIWSLGQPGFAASFTFDAATPEFQVGGPNANFGGSAVTANGSTVTGQEGNGVVQFIGSFTSLSWTSTPENFYGFTVGTAGTVAAIPEPSTWALLVAGLLALGGVRRMSGRR